MRFIQIVNHRKFALISIFLTFYVALNLLDGERGLISYYEKKEIKKNLIIEKNILSNKLTSVEKKNNLLTENLDLDFLEMIYREKFMVGKSIERIYKNILE